jgi:RNA polymerase sigma-70 factor (ECF subfamily)
MSEQPEFKKVPISSTTAEDTEDLQETETNALQEETQADEERDTPTAPVSEDFEAGVIAQLDSLYRTALRMTNNPQEAENHVESVPLFSYLPARY